MSDTNKTKPWALGGYFYFREGDKYRINQKSLNIVLFLIFLVSLVIAIFSDAGAPAPSHKSRAFDSPDINASAGKAEAFYKKVTIEVSKKPKPQQKTVTALNPAIYSRLEKIDGRAELGIPPGTQVMAKLITGASNGPVRAVLTQAIKVQGSKLVDGGNILLGHGQSTKERLLVTFSQLVFKDGQFKRIKAVACDQSDKMPGLLGSNVRGVALKWAGAAGLGVLGGAALGLQEHQQQGAEKKPSTRDAMLSGVAVASLDQAKNISRDIENTEPLIEVPEQTEFYVLFSGE